MTERTVHTAPDTAPLERAAQLVSLIIPVYNEGDHLAEFLRLVDALDLGVAKELVIIDDCSKDNSVEIIKSFPFTSKVEILTKSQNEGKGSAIRAGIERATGTIIGVQDADFEYNMKDIPRVIDPILQGQADVVFGSRYKNSTLVHRTFHYLVNRGLTTLSNLASGLYLSDMETCYKFFKAEIIKSMILETNRFGFEPEVTAKLARLKLRLAEVSIDYFPRNYIEGKKITWRDGIAALGHIVYFNFVTPWQRCFRQSLNPKYIPKAQHWL
jgi:glycosyltransferase involved in cell wall biosynthesis